MEKILVATRNEGKLKEYAELLQGFSIEWLSLTAVGVTEDVAETGHTFLENALIKGRAYANRTKLLTLADDSGLEVDALGGAPGVWTARYGGESLTSKERYQLLLQNLKEVPFAGRTARFRCAIVIVGADGRLLGKSEGICEGYIAERPRGAGGFGYDPVFFLPQLGKTMAELQSSEKHQISHRGNALRQIRPLVKDLLNQQM